MIDIHCHVLPEVDDGAKNIEQSLEMLRIAAKDGITDIIATPHFHYRRGHASPEEIRRKVQELNAASRKDGVNITVYPGNELYYTHELLEKVKAGEALTLADSDYVLLEFSPDVEKSKLQRAVYKFLGEGYYPIIAHMERYEAFRKDREFTYTIEEMGAYYQINAGSLPDMIADRDIDVVFHIAWQGVSDLDARNEAIQMRNLQSTLDLIDAMHIMKIGCFIKICILETITEETDNAIKFSI